MGSVPSFFSVFLITHSHTHSSHADLSVRNFFCKGSSSLMEICDFGTVLYPFTTINKVLYSVFFFILSNGYRDFDLKFDIEIYRGDCGEAEKYAFYASSIILCCKDSWQYFWDSTTQKYLYLFASYSWQAGSRGRFACSTSPQGNSIAPTVSTLDIGHTQKKHHPNLLLYASLHSHFMTITFFMPLFTWPCQNNVPH